MSGKKQMTNASSLKVKPDFKAREFTWIRLWFHYLKENKDYVCYCSAKRSGDEVAQARLGRKSHSKVHEIYAYWGDIYFDESGRKMLFDDWIPKHAELFFPDPGIVQQINADECNEGATTISIPHTLERKQVLEQIDTLLSQLSKAGLQRKPEPKYKIYPNGVLDNSQAKSLYKALKVFLMFKARDAGSKKYKTVPAIAAELSVQDDVYWNWELDEEADKKYHIGELTKDDVETKIVQVRALKSRANKIIANTIRGYFPREDIES